MLLLRQSAASSRSTAPAILRDVPHLWIHARPALGGRCTRREGGLTPVLGHAESSTVPGDAKIRLMAGRNYSDELRRQAVDLYESAPGATLMGIAADLGIARGHVVALGTGAGDATRRPRRAANGYTRPSPMYMPTPLCGDVSRGLQTYRAWEVLTRSRRGADGLSPGRDPGAVRRERVSERLAMGCSVAAARRPCIFELARRPMTGVGSAGRGEVDEAPEHRRQPRGGGHDPPTGERVATHGE